MVEILKAVDLQLELPNGDAPPTDEDYLEAIGKAFTGGENLEEEVIQQAIIKHQKSAITTNHRGYGSSRAIEAGKYYLFGVGATGEEVLIWHQPIRIEAGRRKLNRTESG